MPRRWLNHIGLGLTVVLVPLGPLAVRLRSREEPDADSGVPCVARGSRHPRLWLGIALSGAMIWAANPVGRAAAQGQGAPFGTASADHANRASSASAIEAVLQEGDLIFQRGNGVYPGLLAIVLPESRGFCHVGVVVRRGSQLMVAHVEPRVRGRGGHAELEPVAAFLASTHTQRAALYRITSDSSGIPAQAAEAALRLAEDGRPFDWELDQSTDDRLYCTELVWRAYLEAGFALVRERDLARRKWRGQLRCVITPGSILNSGNVRWIGNLVG